METTTYTEMRCVIPPVGRIVQPSGPYGLDIKQPYYDSRYNGDLNMLQVKILFLDQGWAWINIEQEWIQ